MEQQLRIDNEYTTLANKAKSNFIASVSHDLRTPLHTMLGIAELLHIKQHYPEQEELIEGIIQSGKYLLKQLEQILQLSESESKRQPIAREHIDRHPLIQEFLQESRERKSHKPMTKSLHVLVVEDEPLIQKFTRAILIEFGCTVSLASQGQTAIDQLQEPFDLIFMDIGLPDMSGLQVTRHIRESNTPNQNTPIVALTAQASERDRALCLSTGVNDFLTKPASYVHFQRLLNKYQSA